MKTCPQCGRTFSDLVKQCPACGRDLGVENEDRTIKNDIPTPPPTPNIPNQSQPTPTINSANKTGNSSIKDTITDAEQKSGWFNRWIGSIAAIIGLLCVWDVDIYIGAAFALFGIIAGLASSNNVNKVISVTVGAVSISLAIIVLLI